MACDMKYKWILFDADETLFEFHAFPALVNIGVKYGFEFSQQDFAEYENINQPLWLKYQQQQLTVAQLKNKRFEHLTEKFGVDTQVLNQEFSEQMSRLSPTFNGTVATLEHLHGKVKMGIITNGFSAMQQPRLEFTQTAKFFDLLVISEEVGVPKPHPAIFSFAFQQIQNQMPTEKSQILMVGDSLSADIAGGNEFGIDTCWLNRHQICASQDIQPTFEIQEISDLVNLVKVA